MAEKRVLAAAGASDALRQLLPRPPRPPSVNRLPAWFGRLQSTFSTLAQILAALVLALVFSRRLSADQGVNDVFRIALLLSLLGLLAASAGVLPSLPRGVQAILLGYTLAGLLSSASAVVLIAGRWVK